MIDVRRSWIGILASSLDKLERPSDGRDSRQRAGAARRNEPLPGCVRLDTWAPANRTPSPGASSTMLQIRGAEVAPSSRGGTRVSGVTNIVPLRRSPWAGPKPTPSPRRRTWRPVFIASVCAIGAVVAAAVAWPRPAVCLFPGEIKGNVSISGERIYHVPGQAYYDETRIDRGRGERWFCSEAEARAAGWRRARV